MALTLRKRIFLLLLGLCLIGGPACSQNRNAPRSEPFFFIQMADSQFGMFAKNKDFKKETELFEQAIAHANRLKPVFVVICGDLIHKTHDPKQIAEFLRISNKLDNNIPLYLVAGNHDVQRIPTGQSLRLYRQHFGKDWYSFNYNGCKFITINSAIIQEPENVEDELQRQRAWLENELDFPPENKPTHTIVFQHHPYFVGHPNEKDSYANIPRRRRADYLDLLSDAGVTALFCGHLHKNKLTRFGTMELVATSAIGKPHGKDPSGFRIVKVYQDRIEHRFYGLNAIPRHIELKTPQTTSLAVPRAARLHVFLLQKRMFQS
ncbi:MAG: metallophosphoesterase [Planctomycetota bacterium]|jgi:3',5'-cyclic AMP phosphodiesterase CpdA